ncbi:MAG: hypothetical protein ABI954_04715, partial [Pyrinomonadaceae bacterium]
FRAEIRASIAHCNGLFRAGAVTRPEAERLKNGLWTILKRADFDRNYFDNTDSADIYAFVEGRLFQLINEAAKALEIGRSRPHRAAVALRLWLRDEIEIIIESLENLIQILQSLPNYRVFAAFAESFKRDNERLQEISLRTNQMPCPTFEPSDEATAEIDFELIAHELGFGKVLENPIDSANDRDFCVEFAGAASLLGLHLSNLANTVLNKFEMDESNRQSLETLRGKCVKTFGHQTILLSLLKGLPIEGANELDEVCEIVFDAADTLKFCLPATVAALEKLA